MQQSIPQTRIFDTISKARLIFEKHGNRLLTDHDISRLLKKYRDAIGRTAELMRQMGVHRQCSRCASEGPGGCCFPGIEEGYDHILLLINLLMGCSPPDVQEVAGSCTFVGPHGCKLLARYYYCVHFLCPGLHDVLEPLSVKILLRTVGEELQAGWETERAIHAWLKRQERPDGGDCPAW
ncbi:MAG: hypothetical protein GX422_17610 [Deltaproteobacteria bacterium]|nr:hypothetical protein [Deltaproteobacteria bacterium]